MAKRVTKKIETKETENKKSTTKTIDKKIDGGKRKAPPKSTQEKVVDKPVKVTPKRKTPLKEAPAKVEEPIKQFTTLELIEQMYSTRKKPLKNKNSERKFVKISADSTTEEYNKIGKQIQQGELQWSFYAIDGNIGYHYYLKLK